MIESLLLAVGLFCLGLYLSAVFSGSETAFYRASTLRLTFDAAAGSVPARRILTFAKRPARFVATILIGNNVANYLATAAVGVGVGAVVAGGGGWAEVLATWAVAPVVFVCGELLPKQLCYRAPSHFLTRAAGFLRACVLVTAPLNAPLAALAKLMEGKGGTGRSVGGAFGRTRLTELLKGGKEAGLLTEAQDRLVEGVLRIAPGRAADHATPPERAVCLPVGCDREAVLRESGRLGVREVLLVNGDPASPGDLSPADPRYFAGYVRAAEVAAEDDRPPRLLVRPLPLLPAAATKLEALVELRRCGEAVGLLVTADDGGGPAGRVVGVLRERPLVRELFGRL